MTVYTVTYTPTHNDACAHTQWHTSDRLLYSWGGVHFQREENRLKKLRLLEEEERQKMEERKQRR